MHHFLTGRVVSVTVLSSSNESFQISTRGVLAYSKDSSDVTNFKRVALLYVRFVRFSHGTGMHHVTKSADVEKKKKKKKSEKPRAARPPSRVTHGSRYGTPFVSSSKKRGQWK